MNKRIFIRDYYKESKRSQEKNVCDEALVSCNHGQSGAAILEHARSKVRGKTPKRNDNRRIITVPKPCSTSSFQRSDSFDALLKSFMCTDEDEAAAKSAPKNDQSSEKESNPQNLKFPDDIRANTKNSNHSELSIDDILNMILTPDTQTCRNQNFFVNSDPNYRTDAQLASTSHAVMHKLPQNATNDSNSSDSSVDFLKNYSCVNVSQKVNHFKSTNSLSKSNRTIRNYLKENKEIKRSKDSDQFLLRTLVTSSFSENDPSPALDTCFQKSVLHDNLLTTTIKQNKFIHTLVDVIKSSDSLSTTELSVELQDDTERPATSGSSSFHSKNCSSSDAMRSSVKSIPSPAKSFINKGPVRYAMNRYSINPKSFFDSKSNLTQSGLIDHTVQNVSAQINTNSEQPFKQEMQVNQISSDFRTRTLGQIQLSELIDTNDQNVSSEIHTNEQKQFQSFLRSESYRHDKSLSESISATTKIDPNINSKRPVDVHTISQIGTERWLRSAVSDVNTIAWKGTTKIYPVQDSENKENIKPTIKRYRKGKIKIYRIRNVQSKNAAGIENLAIEDVIENLTQSFTKERSKCNNNDSVLSGTSVPSSYVTDESKSETLSTTSSDLTGHQYNLRSGFNRIAKDKSLLCKDRNITLAADKDIIKMKIQQLFLDVFEALEEGKVPCLNVRRKSYENCTFDNDMLQMKPVIEAEMKKVNYSNSSSRFRFCLILHIMAKIHMLLENNTKLTKREIFYQIKHIIKNQTQLNNAIDDISCLLNVGQWELNIISHRGVVYGDLKIRFASSKEILNCNTPGIMIPYDLNHIVELRSGAYFILVVEKEAIFHKLLEEDLPNKLARPFLMISGKGFPDLNTQLFLKKLWSIMSIPVFILVDADPHGVQIMINYRFGSLNNSHLSHHLAVPNARWLGVFPSEIVKLGINNITMTYKERKLAQGLIEIPYMKNHPRILEQLSILLDKNQKASIEGLIKSDNFLSSSYLPTKFFKRDYI